MAILRNVAKTDTLEAQRQQINFIGNDLYNVLSGSADISVNKLSLGNGSKQIPSLYFTTDSTLGIYKSDDKQLSIVSDNKTITDFSNNQISFKKNIFLTKTYLTSSQISIFDSGSNYTPGNYNDVQLYGGSGFGSTANFVVTEYIGDYTENNFIDRYKDGEYTNILLSGGSGEGSVANFTITTLTTANNSIIQSPGSGYIAGSYFNVPLIGGSGTGKTALIEIEGDIIYNGSITNPGINYIPNTYTNIDVLSVPTNIYPLKVATKKEFSFLYGKLQEWDVTNNSNISYTFTGVNVVSSGENITLNVEKGDRIVLNVNNPGHPFWISNTSTYSPSEILNVGVSGNGSEVGTITIDTNLITEGTYYYVCENHPSMFGEIVIGPFTGSEFSPGDTIQSDQIINGYEYEWDVVNNQTTSYSFTGASSGEDIAILVQQGDLLIFNVNAPGHPFWISTSTQTPAVPADALPPDEVGFVTNNGTDNGVVTVDTRGLQSETTYYYFSGNYPDFMAGPIIISAYSGDRVLNENFTPNQEISYTNSVTSTIDYVDNLSNIKYIRFTSSTGGTFAAGDQIISDSGSYGLIQLEEYDTTVYLTTSDAELSTLTLQKSNTYQFNLSDVSNLNIDFILKTVNTTDFPTNEVNYIQKGNSGSMSSFASVSISPYMIDSYIRVRPNVLNSSYTYIPVSSSSVPPGNYSFGATANIEVNSSGEIDFFEFVDLGLFQTDNVTSTLTIYSGDVGSSGSDFEYTVSSKTFTGQVSNVVIANPGTGYSENDILTINSSDVGGFGSGFTLLLYNTKSISDLTFSDKGTNYLPGDILTLPPKISNVTSFLNSTSNTITISDTTGIYENFVLEKVSGDGEILENTYVISVVNSTTLILSQNPSVDGSIVLNFIPPYGDSNGFEWEISKLGCIESFSIVDAGSGYEVNDILTANREDLSSGSVVSGTDLQLKVNNILSENLLTANVSTGELYALSITSPNTQFTNSSINSLSSPDITGDVIALTEINSSGNIDINATNEINIAATRVDVGANIQAILESGNISTTGRISSSSLNILDTLIVDDEISSTTGNDIILSPASLRVVRINSTSGLQIPAGSTSQRPQSGVVFNGSIRYNTDTDQYEGYSESTSSWSSLGGVRDLDGNTYVLAEQFTGANDNTFYFYNDNQNTLKITPTALDFRVSKTISSSNISAPTFTNWTENTPVTLGQYLRYRNNIYVVSISGVTSDSTNPPIHSNGSQLNGTAELTWNSLAVDDLTFDGIKEVKIGPFKNTPLVVSEEIKILNNTVSTLNLDLKLSPFSGKKLIVESNTSIQIPSGTTEERGIPGQGSIRYSTTDNQFEGFNGTSWTSLGGVRDVDGNTFIIPETSPGSNENILYFYNDGNNTVQLSTTALTLKTVNTIETDTANIDINASTINIDNDTLTLSTSASETKFSTTSDNLEFAVSSGLFNDVVFRATNTGDLEINSGFGTGTPSYTTFISNDLTTFELRDTNIISQEVSLVKGTNDFGLITVFDPSVHKGAKIALIADNTNTNDREMIEFSVIVKGTDIFHTEYGNMNTGSGLVEVTFDFDGSNNVRITPTLLSSVANGNTVNVTAVITIIKK